jgi:hypothetical protein
MTRETLADELDRFVFGVLSNGPVLLGVAIATLAVERAVRRIAFWRRPGPSLLAQPNSLERE